MNLNRDKINLAMARKKMTITQMAQDYGVSRARMNVILNSTRVTPSTAGRLSDVLGVDVTEIIQN